MEPSELDADRVMFEIERVLQSKSDWMFSDPMQILFVHVPLPEGGIGAHLFSARLVQFLQGKRSIIRVTPAPNNTCCARAILLAMMHRDNEKERLEFFKRVQARLDPLVRELHHTAGVPVGVMCGRREWELFQGALGREYDLVVLSRDYFNSIVYRGNPDARKLICIYHAERHFHAVTSLLGFMRQSYLCPHCLKPYEHPGEHR